MSQPRWATTPRQLPGEEYESAKPLPPLDEAVPAHSAGNADMVDGGLAAQSDALLAAVFDVTGQSRVHTLINTHWHPAQTGSNEAAGREGAQIVAHARAEPMPEPCMLYRRDGVRRRAHRGHSRS